MQSRTPLGNNKPGISAIASPKILLVMFGCQNAPWSITGASTVLVQSPMHVQCTLFPVTMAEISGCDRGESTLCMHRALKKDNASSCDVGGEYPKAGSSWQQDRIELCRILGGFFRQDLVGAQMAYRYGTYNIEDF